MFYVYILKSVKNKRFYIGSTKNMKLRLYRHNAGFVKSTAHRRPIELVYIEKYKTLSEARRRELQIKSYKGGRAFKNILKSMRR